MSPAAATLTDPAVNPADLRDLLTALTAVRDGNYSGRLRENREGILGEIAVVFNEVVVRKLHLTKELPRTATGKVQRRHVAAAFLQKSP